MIVFLSSVSLVHRVAFEALTAIHALHQHGLLIFKKKFMND